MLQISRQTAYNLRWWFAQTLLYIYPKNKRPLTHSLSFKIKVFLQPNVKLRLTHMDQKPLNSDFVFQGVVKKCMSSKFRLSNNNSPICRVSLLCHPEAGLWLSSVFQVASQGVCVQGQECWCPGFLVPLTSAPLKMSDPVPPWSFSLNLHTETSRSNLLQHSYNIRCTHITCVLTFIKKYIAIFKIY